MNEPQHALLVGVHSRREISLAFVFQPEAENDGAVLVRGILGGDFPFFRRCQLKYLLPQFLSGKLVRIGVVAQFRVLHAPVAEVPAGLRSDRIRPLSAEVHHNPHFLLRPAVAVVVHHAKRGSNYLPKNGNCCILQAQAIGIACPLRGKNIPPVC